MNTFPPTRRRWLLAAVVPIAALVAACVPPPSPGPSPTTSSTTTTAAPKHVMSIGHADALEATVSGNALVLQIKDDSNVPTPGVVFRDPTETILHAKPGASPAGSQLNVPASPTFSFLGDPGDPVWILPEVQNSNLLWPGLSTERINSGVLQGNQVQYHLESVSGPGDFHMYNSTAFGGVTIRYTTDAAFPQTLTAPINTHAHYSWAFSEEGTYTLTFRATATLANGTQISSPSVPYTFVVGPL
jgi:surface-anchored protein